MSIFNNIGNYNSIDINRKNRNEEEEINSTNNLIDELTFGCSTNSFKKPSVNIINLESSLNNNKTESEVLEVSEDLKEFQDIKKIVNKYDKNDFYNINIDTNNTNKNNIDNFDNIDNTNKINSLYNINNIDNNNRNSINDMKTIKENYDTLNSIKSIANTIKENKNNIFNNPLRNVIYENKNEIISIHSTKKDMTLTSRDSSILRQDNESITQSLLHMIYGNKTNNRNELSSNNSNFNYINSIKDNEEVNQSLINLIKNRNDIISNKSNGIKKENINLDNMFKDLNNKLKMKEIENKILNTY